MNPAPLATLLGGGVLLASSVLGVVVLSGNGSGLPDPSLGGGGTSAKDNGAKTSNPGHPIRLSGVVSGQISPGRPATLTVTVSNPNHQDLVVTSLTGTITSVTSLGLAGLPSCSPAWYDVGSFFGTRPVAAKGSVNVVVPVSLADLPATNQDNCKGSTVQLSFTAQARQP